MTWLQHNSLDFLLHGRYTMDTLTKRLISLYWYEITLNKVNDLPDDFDSAVDYDESNGNIRRIYYILTNNNDLYITEVD